jgi:hypothetical protein
MAKEAGVSHQTISRIWHTFGLQPTGRKASHSPPIRFFVEKVRTL